MKVVMVGKAERAERAEKMNVRDGGRRGRVYVENQTRIWRGSAVVQVVGAFVQVS